MCVVNYFPVAAVPVLRLCPSDANPSAAFQCPVCGTHFQSLTNYQHHASLHLPSRQAVAGAPLDGPSWGSGYLNHRQPCLRATADAVQLCGELLEELLAACLLSAA